MLRQFCTGYWPQYSLDWCKSARKGIKRLCSSGIESHPYKKPRTEPEQIPELGPCLGHLGQEGQGKITKFSWCRMSSSDVIINYKITAKHIKIHCFGKKKPATWNKKQLSSKAIINFWILSWLCCLQSLNLMGGSIFSKKQGIIKNYDFP